MVWLIKVGAKSLVSGVRWQYLDDTSVKAGKRTKKLSPEAYLAKQHRALIVAKTSSPKNYGYLTKEDVAALGGLPLFGKIYGIADMFSGLPNLPDLAILVTPIEDNPGYFVMCVSKSQQPLADQRYDTVVAKDQVADLLKAWQFDLAQHLSTSVAVYGQWSEAVPMSLAQLVEESEFQRPMTRVGYDLRIVAPLVTSVAVAVAGGYGYQHYEKQKAIKKARAQQMKTDPIRVYNAALIAQWPQIQWGTPERAGAIVRGAGAVPLDVGGFSLEGDVTCDVASAVCSFSYKRRDGSFVSFTEAVRGRFVTKTFGQDGNTVEVEMTLAGLPDIQGPQFDWQYLPREDSLPLLFWPEVHKFPDTLVSGQMQPNYQLFPPMPEANPGALPKMVRTVPVQITFPLWGHGEVPPKTGPMATAVSWKQVRITSSSAKVTVSGEMYAQKEQAPL